MAHEDVQALVAFLGDCADPAVVEDVAQALAAMLVPSGFVCRQLTTVCQVRFREETNGVLRHCQVRSLIIEGSRFLCGRS